MTAPKVLQFVCPVGLYGAERWVLALCNNLRDREPPCDLAVTRESADQDLSVSELFRATGGVVHEVPMASRFDLRAATRLARVIREGGYSLIHTHGYKSDIIGVLAARLAGIRCISTPHGADKNASGKMRLYIEAGEIALRFCDAVVPLSEELESEMLAAGVRRDRVRLVRNGVDLSEVDEGRNPPTSDTAQDVPRIGYVGQLIERKGVDRLIRAFARVRATHPDLRFSIIGDGAERPRLEALAVELGCDDAVDFLGYRTDRLDLVSGFRLFVMASRSEGIPRCLMESLALRVPVVAWDIPGVDQIVLHERTGLLAPLDDDDGLASGIARLLEDDALREACGRQGRELVEERFSAARMAQEYEAIFTELAGGGAA